jgi:hypothetical protein
MPQKALSMWKIKEVLRLRYDLRLLENEIAHSVRSANPLLVVTWNELQQGV